MNSTPGELREKGEIYTTALIIPEILVSFESLQKKKKKQQQNKDIIKTNDPMELKCV